MHPVLPVVEMVVAHEDVFLGLRVARSEAMVAPEVGSSLNLEGPRFNITAGSGSLGVAGRLLISSFCKDGMRRGCVLGQALAPG